MGAAFARLAIVDRKMKGSHHTMLQDKKVGSFQSEQWRVWLRIVGAVSINAVLLGAPLFHLML